MPHHSSPAGTTTYLVTVRREQVAELAVNATSRQEARAVARARTGGGEALVWATIGEPLVVGAEPIAETTEAVTR